VLAFAAAPRAAPVFSFPASLAFVVTPAPLAAGIANSTLFAGAFVVVPARNAFPWLDANTPALPKMFERAFASMIAVVSASACVRETGRFIRGSVARDSTRPRLRRKTRAATRARSEASTHR